MSTPMSTTTHAEAGAPRMAGVIGVLDRFFPAVWLLFYVSLPVSGWAPLMFDSWFDQRRDLEALESVLATGRADAIADSVIGPAYIGAAAFLHTVLGLSPEDALVALTRGSYALSVVAGMLLVRALVRQLVTPPHLVSLASQFAFVAVVFATGTWHWSDVPWSHFFAMFLAAGLFAVRYAPERFGVVHAAVAGCLVALLALTRTFELLALVIAALLALALLSVCRVRPARAMTVRHLVAGAATFAATTAIVYLQTGKRDLFLLYGNHLDRQAGNVTSAEVAETPTFSLGLVPHKLTQLFVEPCHYALCSVADYAGGASPLPPPLAEAAGNERLWRLPLAIQLPALALLPVCVVVVGVMLVRFMRRTEVADATKRSLQLLLELTISASAIVLGYAASTMTGSPHLRYGFARDFLLPSLLVSVVVVALSCAGLWLLVDRRWRLRISTQSVFVLVVVFGSIAVIAGAAYARANGIPRIESKQLEAVDYTARCAGSTCTISVEASTRAGRRTSIPESSVLTFGCGTDRAQLSVYVASLDEPVRSPLTCLQPRLVAAWPTVMGLPPGSYELSFVTVRNL